MWVKKMRICMLGLIAYGQVLAMLTIVIGGPVWFLLLIIGGSILLAAMVCYVIYKINFAPVKEVESAAVRAARLRRVQDRMLKQGITRATSGRNSSRLSQA